MPTDSPDPSQPRRRISYEMIVALAAVVIGVATLIVYMYQARIMREQQRSSVWPYIEWTLTLSTETGFDVDVVNKGVGPALIQAVTLKLDGKPMTDATELMNALLGPQDTLSYATQDIAGVVMAPGEHIHFLQIAPNKATRKLDRLVYDRITLQICYCSIYHECWTSSGKKSLPGPCK